MVHKIIEKANKVGDKVHAIEFLVILTVQLSTTLIISRNFLMKSISILHFIKSKKKISFRS